MSIEMREARTEKKYSWKHKYSKVYFFKDE